jgi:hypothetical protein
MATIALLFALLFGVSPVNQHYLGPQEVRQGSDTGH